MEQQGVDRPDEVIDFNSIKPNTLPHGKTYHIFLSYKSDNRDRRIAIQIDRLLRENSSASEWCEFELIVTERFHIENRGYNPIILKLEQCKLPDTLKKYTYLSADRPIEEWIGRLALAINNKTDHFITNRRTIRFVPVPCNDYNRDKDHRIDKCRYPHICAKHIMNNEECDGNCGKNHNLVTNQSREILVDLGFITDGNYDSLLKTYRQKCKEKLADMAQTGAYGVTGPCCYYNYEGCFLGDFHCPFTHICEDWFLGTCVKMNCTLSHDILNDHTTRLLKIFKIDTTQDKAVILNKYRAKYQHKTFITMKESVSTSTFLRENLLSVVVGVLLIVGITAFFVMTYRFSI
ncbi:unnamed protein product [Mytilus edulis]|uniref:TIR domain-containing protein n=1 Tax=Mytilus edulis TaxID=6550 RepID=A0A8S3RYA9_MYTED|nr:unnamed protein product [Mytilus edulis]